MVDKKVFKKCEEIAEKDKKEQASALEMAAFVMAVGMTPNITKKAKLEMINALFVHEMGLDLELTKEEAVK